MTSTLQDTAGTPIEYEARYVREGLSNWLVTVQCPAWQGKTIYASSGIHAPDNTELARARLVNLKQSILAVAEENQHPSEGLARFLDRLVSLMETHAGPTGHIAMRVISAE